MIAMFAIVACVDNRGGAITVDAGDDLTVFEGETAQPVSTR